jgi:hypothetical protein
MQKIQSFNIGVGVRRYAVPGLVNVLGLYHQLQARVAVIADVEKAEVKDITIAALSIGNELPKDMEYLGDVKINGSSYFVFMGKVEKHQETEAEKKIRKDNEAAEKEREKQQAEMVDKAKERLSDAKKALTEVKKTKDKALIAAATAEVEKYQNRVEALTGADKKDSGNESPEPAAEKPEADKE